MKLLIIDDEILVRKSLERAFSQKFSKIETATDGSDGLNKWKSGEFDVVLLDMLMPEMTGPEVLDEIGEAHNSYVILMSAFSGEYNIEKAQEMGGHFFIEKPFDSIFMLVETVIQEYSDFRDAQAV